MTSKAWRSIERAKEGKRSSGRLKREERPPHLQVICSSDGDDERLPALASNGALGVEDFIWISHPEKPRKQPVVVFSTADAGEPDYVITPGKDGHTPSEVRAGDGSTVLTAHQNTSVFRSSWTIHTPDRYALFSIVERKRDAFWRRVFGPATKLENPALEWLGLAIMVLFLPAMLRPPVRMLVTDPAGASVGMVTFASGYQRPRESFCLYLDDQPFPIRDTTLPLAVLAIVQRMR